MSTVPGIKWPMCQPAGSGRPSRPGGDREPGPDGASVSGRGHLGPGGDRCHLTVGKDANAEPRLAMSRMTSGSATMGDSAGDLRGCRHRQRPVRDRRHGEAAGHRRPAVSPGESRTAAACRPRHKGRDRICTHAPQLPDERCSYGKSVTECPSMPAPSRTPTAPTTTAIPELNINRRRTG